MKVVTIASSEGGGYTVPLTMLAIIEEDLREHANDDCEALFTLTTSEMDDEDYYALDEFSGW